MYLLQQSSFWQYFLVSTNIERDYVELVWLNIIIMSRASVRMNLHSIVAWMSRNSLQAPYLKFKWQDTNPQPISS